MQTSTKGIEFIVKEEGFRLSSYLCAAGIWTIGIGHTGNVKSGMKITKEYAYELLIHDLKRFENVVNENTKAQLKQHEFDALVSLTFNIGCNAFKNSTLLKKINTKADSEEIEQQFLRWKYGGGKILPGLLARRKREFKMFVEGDYGIR